MHIKIKQNEKTLAHASGPQGTLMVSDGLCDLLTHQIVRF